jgi:hypothetical protein
VVTIDTNHLEQLIAIEAHVHYGQPPLPGRDPFVVVRRPSPVLISAPHGAITYRNNERQEWHDEDDYTAGMALLLSDLCGTCAIATVWRTDDSDPNYHAARRSPYKRALRRLVGTMGVRWVIDLHGAADTSLPSRQLVDLGTRREKRSLPKPQLRALRAGIEDQLGEGTVSSNVFPAYVDRRTITAYSHGVLELAAVQIEMKSAARVPWRRADATAYAENGPFSARPEDVIGMLQALADFCLSL